MNENQSYAGSLNTEDVKKWARNILVFLAPLLAIYIGTVISNLDALGGAFSLDIFKLTPLMQGSLALYFLNAIMDLLRKITQGPTLPTP